MRKVLAVTMTALIAWGTLGDNSASGEAAVTTPTTYPGVHDVAASPTPPIRVAVTLRRGDRGFAVAALQAGLTTAGWPTGVDGIFGRHTERMVRGFQRANRLRVDGVAGPVTLGRLARVLETTTPTFTDDCDEMSWYRQQVGLPAVFDAIGWRESNCRNEDGVHTYCCYGWWQLYISVLAGDQHMRPRLAACGVDSYLDVNSDAPDDKRRQACVAKALYDVAGMTPWAL